MGTNANCCEKDEIIDQIIQERKEIFNYSPEDDKIPDDASFITNHGGEYPNETEEPANFKYEAKYPNLVDGEKIIIQNLGPEHILQTEDDDEDYVMKVLAPDGTTQMHLEGGERIVSRRETVVLIKKALKAEESKEDKDYKALGKYIFKVLKGQDTREPEYVNAPEKKEE